MVIYGVGGGGIRASVLINGGQSCSREKMFSTRLPGTEDRTESRFMRHLYKGETKQKKKRNTHPRKSCKGVAPTKEEFSPNNPI